MVKRTDGLSGFPFCELDVDDVSLEGVRLQLRLQRLPDDAGSDVRVLNVAERKKTRLINNY